MFRTESEFWTVILERLDDFVPFHLLNDSNKEEALNEVPALSSAAAKSARFKQHRRLTLAEEQSGVYFKQVQHVRRGFLASTNLEHLRNLNIDEPVYLVRKTSIICTLGPASRSVEMIVNLILNGMSIARLNFSHGSHEYHAETIQNIRAALSCFNEPKVLAIALDTRGPEIRTGVLEGGASAEVQLEKGDKIKVVVDEKYKDSCSASLLFIDYHGIIQRLKKNSRIFIDDGLISLLVEEVGE
ncbi:unnamed protein product [Soboliphyme baturini]|uniref:pyruvate kinase n=1 Tax=Soboliphyme baturini TaxID=241478 RepID=A0A183ICC3_9BILA|nr:unnamed protein product [Soboliphyme baturini]